MHHGVFCNPICIKGWNFNQHKIVNFVHHTHQLYRFSLSRKKGEIIKPTGKLSLTWLGGKLNNLGWEFVTLFIKTCWLVLYLMGWPTCVRRACCYPCAHWACFAVLANHRRLASLSVTFSTTGFPVWWLPWCNGLSQGRHGYHHDGSVLRAPTCRLVWKYLWNV